MNLILKIRSLSNHKIISMIFYWIVIVFSLMLFSCETNVESKKTENKIKGRSISITTLDSCEYYLYDDGLGSNRVFSLTHKGNCKNPIHYKKIIYDTVEYQIIKKK